MIRVLVAEDMHLIRGALVALIGLEDDMEVVAELDRGDLIEPTALRVEPMSPSSTSTCRALTV